MEVAGNKTCKLEESGGRRSGKQKMMEEEGRDWMLLKTEGVISPVRKKID